MGQFRNLATFVLCAFCALFVLTSAVTAQTREFDRWIGEIEGKKDIIPGGGAFMYDLHFVDGATVRIEKSTGLKLIKQSFPYTWTDSGINLGPVENSAIPEFNNAQIARINDRRYDVTIFETEKTSFRPVVISYAWMQWVFLFAVVFVGNELCRKYKYFNHFLWIMVPVVLTPMLWVHNEGYQDWFRWVKLYSAVAGCLIFMAFRFHGLNRFSWFKFFVAGILAVNIFEAVLQDFSTHQTLNIINGVAGALNIATICHIMSIKRDENAPHDMLWPGMTIFWILAYDIWNVTFVYINFPNTVFNTLAILSAPTIAALFIKRGTWLQARANTLAIYMMYLFTTYFFYYDTLSYQTTLPLYRNDLIVYALVGASILANVALALFYFRWKFTGKAPEKLQIGQSESVI